MLDSKSATIVTKEYRNWSPTFSSRDLLQCHG